MIEMIEGLFISHWNFFFLIEKLNCLQQLLIVSFVYSMYTNVLTSIVWWFIDSSMIHINADATVVSDLSAVKVKDGSNSQNDAGINVFAFAGNSWVVANFSQKHHVDGCRGIQTLLISATESLCLYLQENWGIEREFVVQLSF